MCGTCSATLIDEQGIIAANPETVERSVKRDGGWGEFPRNFQLGWVIEIYCFLLMVNRGNKTVRVLFICFDNSRWRVELKNGRNRDELVGVKNLVFSEFFIVHHSHHEEEKKR